MKQGRDFVFVKVSTALIGAMADGWSRPVQVMLEEHPSGDIELITRERNDVRDAAELIREAFA